jgi:hypothetical protein
MGNLFAKQEKKEVTNEQIKDLVMKILKNKDINLSFLPDSIESKIYEKLLTFGVNEIKELVSTVKIQFLNYEITMDMHPLEIKKDEELK